MKASLSEPTNRADSRPSIEPAAEPALPMAGDAASGGADADALAIGTEVEGRGQQMMKQQKTGDDATAFQLELAGVALSPSILLSSQQRKHSEAVLSSCVDAHHYHLMMYLRQAMDSCLTQAVMTS